MTCRGGWKSGSPELSAMTSAPSALSSRARWEASALGDADTRDMRAAGVTFDKRIPPPSVVWVPLKHTLVERGEPDGGIIRMLLSRDHCADCCCPMFCR